ncbi:MAG: helix-hairpin-helix domain-containing protein [Raineya sp.]|jgi:competence ComEA-like helix-hairpin-helix protein|nr:helix-hairpin-helix domain-containing protein [Raineya sp.]
MISNFQKIIRNYFGFSQKETNGVIVLFGVMGLCIVAPWVQSMMPIKAISNTEDIAKQDSLVAILEKVKAPEKTTFPDIEFQAFDPNKLSKQEWLAFGLNDKIAGRIENYLKKGGKFRKKEDLKRIYDFPEDLYEALEEYIVIENTQFKPYRKYDSKRKEYASSQYKFDSTKKYTSKKKEYTRVITFDLNQADTSEFKKLKGIGEKRAMTIIKYRERLGGFASLNQIDEIFGLDSVAKNSLKQYTFIQTGSWKKININTANLEELKAHIYIGYKLAPIIINYRQQHGKFQSEEDLKKIKVLDTEKIEKLKPYIIY